MCFIGISCFFLTTHKEKNTDFKFMIELKEFVFWKMFYNCINFLFWSLQNRDGKTETDVKLN